MEAISHLTCLAYDVQPHWPTPRKLSPECLFSLEKHSSATVSEVVALALHVAEQEGSASALSIFAPVASLFLNYAQREAIHVPDDLTLDGVRQFILLERPGSAFLSTEQMHLHRNFLMLIHLACNTYGISFPRLAAEVTDLKARKGGPRRPLMDDEITLARIASKCRTLQISDQQRSGRDTRLERAAMLGIIESGAGTSDLTHITARDIYDEGLTTFVHLHGTRDAGPRAVALTKWAQEQCKEMFSQFDIDPDGANGLFYNGRYRPGTPGAQSSTSGVLAEILAFAGLKQIGLKALQLPFWRARSLFDSTGRLGDAAAVLGCSAMKALTHCGIDGDALYGVVSL